MQFFSVRGAYLAYLHAFDSRVPFASARPDAASYSERRPFLLAARLPMGNLYAPLEHPRKRHQSLLPCRHILPIDGGRHGQIALNNMIPVPDAQIAPYSAKGGRHRSMFFRQLDFCANNERLIRSRALEIAKRRASCPNSFEQAAFCDFGALFKAMEAYCPAKGPEGAK